MLSTRRRFLEVSGASLAFAMPAPARPSRQTSNMPPARKSEPLPDALVQEWVWRGHFDLEGVKRMLARHPTLLNAAYDWGNGDYEMAIGGAGHLGNRGIVEYLLTQGSRMDIFVATMLGRIDVVKPMLTAYPALLESRGPHGLTLLHHAEKGGEQAREVLEFLTSLARD